MRRIIQVGAGAVVLVLCYALPHQLLAHVQRSHTASAVVTSHPAPRLFPAATVAPYASALEGEAHQATRLLQGWWTAHGTGRHDRQFAAWLRTVLPAPPGRAARASEAHRLAALAQHRSAAGEHAARWLQTYARRDLWEYYAHQRAGWLPVRVRHRRSMQLRHVMTMAHHVAAKLDHRLQQPGPALLDPALGGRRHPAAHVAGGRVCPCTYPAAADAAAAAGSTFLSHVYPQSGARYRQMADELGYAQLYLGNHLPSDVDAGTLLGDLVGEYFLVSRGDTPVDQLAAA